MEDAARLERWIRPNKEDRLPSFPTSCVAIYALQGNVDYRHGRRHGRVGGLEEGDPP
jgi:hypothetical protein